MAKQEIARVNIDVLGISEVKWTGMGEFNSDDHFIYYYGQEYTEELYKKDLHNPDNHDGVITHLEPDILECLSVVDWKYEFISFGAFQL